jgi:hypothetical protein
VSEINHAVQIESKREKVGEFPQLILPIAEQVADNSIKDVKETSKQSNVEVIQKPDSHINDENLAKCERSKRQHSYPPITTRSVTSGPWSLEWLKDHVHGEAGVVSSSKHTSKQRLKSKVSSIAVESNLKNKMKAVGRLKHPAHNLKKIARLPDNDRKKVLKILMKKVQRRKVVKLADALPDSILKESQTSDSSSSFNNINDWKHWVVLRGKEEEVKNDVKDFGKALGVRFYNDKCNQFRLFLRGRKQNKENMWVSKAVALTE